MSYAARDPEQLDLFEGGERMTWQRVISDDECHGIVTRFGFEEPCEKPTICIVDDPEGAWAACVWHAHCYGSGRMVTLAQIREALS